MGTTAMAEHPLQISRKESSSTRAEEGEEASLGDYLLHTISGIGGLLDDTTQPTPPMNHVRKPSIVDVRSGGGARPPDTPPPIKRHERTISWGIPSMIDVDDHGNNAIDGQGSLLDGVEVPPPQPRRKQPVRSHKRTMTVANVLPDMSTLNPQETDQGDNYRQTGPPTSQPAKQRHTRTRTQAHFPVSGLFHQIGPPTSQNPPPKHTRSRTQAQIATSSLFPSSLFPNFLNQDQDVSNQPPPYSDIRNPTVTSAATSLKPSTKPRINLNDVIMTAPLELEAETHILHALEEQQAEDNTYNNTDAVLGQSEGEHAVTSTILSHVPDDIVHDFRSVEQPETVQGNGNGEVTIVVSEDEERSGLAEQGIECQEADNTQTNNQKSPTIISQMMSQPTATTKKETKPLLPTTVNATSKTKPSNHRHTKSVEQTLFGLTAAMTAMDQTNNPGYNGDNDNNSNEDDDESDLPPKTLPATDKVAKAAHSLAKRLMFKKERSMRNLMNGSDRSPEETPPPATGDDVEAVSNVSVELGNSSSFNNNNTDSLRFRVSVDEEEGRTAASAVPSASFTNNSSNKNHKNEGDSLTSDETEEKENPRDDNPASESGGRTKDQDKPKKRTGRRNVFSRTSNKMKDDWDLFSEVLSPKKVSVYVRNVLFFLIVPALGVSALLFYVFENPHTGVNENGGDTLESDETQSPSKNEAASVSWWLLFLFVRQVVTLSMALATQALLIDVLVIGSWMFLRFFGPVLTLLMVQSKGWPFVLIFWGIYDLILLAGPSRLANHWGYWQGSVGLFNAENPSGNVTSDELYIQILQVAIGVGVAVSLKRLAVGMFLGRQTFAHYGQELASIMQKMVLVSEVAGLAQEIYRSRDEFIPHYWDVGWRAEDYQNMMTPTPAEKEEAKAQQQQTAFEQSEKLIDLLDRWEEPDRARQERKKNISISAVLQFRRAFTYMQRKYPFSSAFGPSDTRKNCIESAQKVYERLLLRTPEKEELNFETIALIAKNDDGSLNEGKVKELIKIFRPDRKGSLSLLEFVKSVDNVYKSLRLLSATVANSGQIDQAFENILNIIFSIILGCLILSFLGYDPLALFFSLSSVILAFAFMFSSASAKYFEGMIFILVQRPYGVGDHIHVSGVDNESDTNGSCGWIVSKVTLFSTTVYWSATNECATMSNAAIANSRIINAARSPHAKLKVVLKFGIDVPYERIVIFKSAVEQYMKARPREWLQLVGFRASNVVVDRGFIEYTIVALHRESWQGIASILESRATLTSYCSEVAKQLDMRYMSPSLPVSLTLATPPDKLEDQGSIHTKDNESTVDAERDFRSMALSHGIKIDK